MSLGPRPFGGNGPSVHLKVCPVSATLRAMWEKARHTLNLGLALSYYPARHQPKVQADYELLGEIDNFSEAESRFQLQMQVAFWAGTGVPCFAALDQCLGS